MVSNLEAPPELAAFSITWVHIGATRDSSKTQSRHEVSHPLQATWYASEDCNKRTGHAQSAKHHDYVALGKYIRGQHFEVTHLFVVFPFSVPKEAPISAEE